jgi:hypothetical protein
MSFGIMVAFIPKSKRKSCCFCDRERNMPKTLTVVKGVILPANWDARGNVTAVAISGTDETEYLVEKSGTGKELIFLINREILAQGRTWGDGRSRVIEVTDYSVVER